MVRETWMVQDNTGELFDVVAGRMKHYGMSPQAAFVDYLSDIEGSDTYKHFGPFQLVSVRITELTPPVGRDNFSEYHKSTKREYSAEAD